MQVGLAGGHRGQTLDASPDPQALAWHLALSSASAPAEGTADRMESWAPTWVPLSCLSLHLRLQLHESRALCLSWSPVTLCPSVLSKHSLFAE